MNNILTNTELVPIDYIRVTKNPFNINARIS